MICASIIEEDVDAMVDAANKVDCDLVELRLDFLSSFTGLRKIEQVKKPVIVTCIPHWDGGRFDGPESERTKILSDAVEYADYVSVELKANPRLRDNVMGEARKQNVKVILSYHDYHSTPSRDGIIDILLHEERTGADIAKAVFIAKKREDVLNAMEALVAHNLKIPVILFCMGELGRITRILSPILGSYLTYASVSPGKEAALGQLTAEEIKNILGAMGYLK